MWRGEEMVDHFFPGIRRTVVYKGLYFSGSRGKADQVEVSAANQSRTIRLGLHLPAFVLQLGEDESVDRRTDLIFGRDGRHSRLDGLAERPPFAVVLRDFRGFAGTRGLFGFSGGLRESAVLYVGFD